MHTIVLCISVTFAILALTKYLLSDATMILAGLPGSFIEWLVAAYDPQNAEEVADMEIMLALAISSAVISTLASLAFLLQRWRNTRRT